MQFIPVYKKLFSSLGPSFWWPAQSSFEIMIGAILTQNTNWKNVEKALGELKKSNLMSPVKIHSLRVDLLAEKIRSSGYYNQKAKKLKAYLEWFSAYEYSEKKIRKIHNRNPAKLRTELLNIFGIGPETADSILCYALKFPFFVVDAYTFRLVERLSGVKIQNYYELQNTVTQEFQKAYKFEDITYHFNEFHALIVRLSYDICTRRNPSCKKCPLVKKCMSAQI